MFSSEIFSIIETEFGPDIVKAFTLNKQYRTQDYFEGLPVYDFEDLDNEMDMNNVEILISIGYNDMNGLRQIIYEECKKKGYHIYTFISKKALVYSKNIGEGSILMPGSYIGPFCSIGICNILKYGVSLPHHVIVGNFNWIAGGTVFGGKAIVGNNCFIGLSSTIRNEIIIANRTFLGAKSYLGHDTVEDCAYYGIPAKQIVAKTSSEIIKRV